jgi:hypothetical protein
MTKILKGQNTEGYKAATSSIQTAGEATKDVNINSALATGAPGSSRANITIGRFDVVPLVKNEDKYFWYGEPEDNN